jgi:hypothetical protein
MVTGQAPFRGTSGEVMYQYQHQHSALPLERLKDVPQPVVVLLEGIRLANLHGVDDARPELWYAPPVAMRAQPRQDTAASTGTSEVEIVPATLAAIFFGTLPLTWPILLMILVPWFLSVLRARQAYR